MGPLSAVATVGWFIIYWLIGVNVITSTSPSGPMRLLGWCALVAAVLIVLDVFVLHRAWWGRLRNRQVQ